MVKAAAMQHEVQPPLVRPIFYFLSFYFFLMGSMLILFPELITRPAGTLPGLILGMLRGTGGSVVPYALMYLFLARHPFAHRPLAWVIAVANVLAIGLDLASVFLGEYRFVYALLDLPFETISLVAIAVVLRKGSSQTA